MNQCDSQVAKEAWRTSKLPDPKPTTIPDPITLLINEEQVKTLFFNKAIAGGTIVTYNGGQQVLVTLSPGQELILRYKSD